MILPDVCLPFGGSQRGLDDHRTLEVFFRYHRTKCDPRLASVYIDFGEIFGEQLQLAPFVSDFSVSPGNSSVC